DTRIDRRRTEAAQVIVKWGRVLLTLVLIPVSISAFHDPLGGVPLISDINLAVHEFGHILFMPFGTAILGETMVILRGSLFQILFPTIFAAYFLFGKREHRDFHAAMLCAWWTATNMLGVS